MAQGERSVCLPPLQWAFSAVGFFFFPPTAPQWNVHLMPFFTHVIHAGATPVLVCPMSSDEYKQTTFFLRRIKISMTAVVKKKKKKKRGQLRCVYMRCTFCGFAGSNYDSEWHFKSPAPWKAPYFFFNRNSLSVLVCVSQSKGNLNGTKRLWTGLI